MKTLHFITIYLVASMLTVGILGCQKDPSQDFGSAKTGENNSTSNAGVYTCPMHPSVVSDRPGACPVCGMALVKKAGESEENLTNSATLTTVTISPSRQVLANITTIHAGKEKLQKQISAVGTISYTEPNYKHISTRFPGRLEKLYVNYTGQEVYVGDPVADIYSPDAIAAQKEYLLAFESVEITKDAHESISSGAVSILGQSRQKLLRWGFTPGQIAELEQSKEVKDIVTIYSPISGTILKKNVDPQHYVGTGEDIFDIVDLSTVWLYADVYEYDMQMVRKGQPIEATADAYPDHIFRGKITFISPTVEPASRTVKVRADLLNPSGLLKVDMFVNATIMTETSLAVAVPKSAIISTGKKNIIWVLKDTNVFEPRTVRLGTESNDKVQVLDGIKEGEAIVVSGGYLLDSESQLQLSSSGTTEHSTHKE